MAKLDQQSSNSEPRRPTGETAQKSPPIVVTKGMTKEDISIATRLQNLKDSRKQGLLITTYSILTKYVLGAGGGGGGGGWWQ